MTDLNVVKPCLRWAGGKSWLVKHLDNLLPNNGFNNYHEPFWGGASIFLSIRPQNLSYLSDLNRELIETYITLRDHPNEIIEILACYVNSKDYYYKIRKLTPQTEAEKAARFIYITVP